MNLNGSDAARRCLWLESCKESLLFPRLEVLITALRVPADWNEQHMETSCSAADIKPVADARYQFAYAQTRSEWRRADTQLQISQSVALCECVIIRVPPSTFCSLAWPRWILWEMELTANWDGPHGTTYQRLLRENRRMCVCRSDPDQNKKYICVQRRALSGGTWFFRWSGDEQMRDL